MSSQIFFDDYQLSKGNYFQLDGYIETDSGSHLEVHDWLGRGGNASVFRVLDRGTGEEFAVKFLLNLKTNNIQRFEREIDLLKQVKSEHIVKYFGNGEIDVEQFIKGKKRGTLKIPYILMELAECNLLEYIQKNSRKISPEEYNGQFRGLAEALADLHNVAVHRDIKPENILVSGDKWLLSDYGLCSFVVSDDIELSQNQQNLGPKFWLSPEGHNRRLGVGDEITESSDVFQLAAIFWFVVTGRHPCGVITQGDWSGTAELFQLLHKSLFHNPDKRPKGGNDFLDGLKDALS